MNDPMPPKLKSDEEETPCRYVMESPKIHWQSIILQAIAQIIVLGGLAIGYVISNERWKGGIDANMNNLVIINSQQTQVNQQLRVAIEKLNENISILSRNQERVVALLEIHMTTPGIPLSVPREPIRR
jgi:hypothetical protein